MQEVPLRRYHSAEFGSGFGCHVHPVGSKWGVQGLSFLAARFTEPLGGAATVAVGAAAVWAGGSFGTDWGVEATPSQADKTPL
jgi:hypothetical protein